MSGGERKVVDREAGVRTFMCCALAKFGLRSNVQVTRECLLDVCSYWYSPFDTGIQGKTFAITLHF